MGWFWQSSPAPQAPASTSTQAPPPPRAAPASPPKPENVDQEIMKFFQMLEAEIEGKPAPPPAPTPSSSASQQVPTPPSKSSWFSWASSTPSASLPSEPPSLDTQTRSQARSPASLALSETQLPTTMSCRDAFDYAWHCHTAGSQWNSVYRYGGVRPCGELWEDFWFCMRTRQWEPEKRAEAIKAHYRAKEDAKYGVDPATGRRRPSSEDVWESRDKVAEPNTEFKETFPRPERADAEFLAEEMEYRRKVREELGFQKK